MSYVTLTVYLGASVLAFIGLLVVVRRYVNGDFTAIKVVVGVALVEIARWAHAAQAGLSEAFRWEQFGLMAVAGGLICAWQLGEWVYRSWERIWRKFRELEGRRD